jgi:lysophospholipase L1-like esterase
MAIIDHRGGAGILAFGDSITNGGGELQFGVALQSWVQWVARGLGLPFTNYAVDGARAADVAGHQIAAHRRFNATPDPHYELGCLYIGVNDVRASDWDPGTYATDLDAAVNYLTQRCDTVLTLTIPLDLGRPRAGVSRVEAANRTIEQTAGRHGAQVLDLRHFGARNLLMADQVHPTAFGQIHLAERALEVLSERGLAVRRHPSSLIAPDPSWLERLKFDWAYTYRRLKQAAAQSLR